MAFGLQAVQADPMPYDSIAHPLQAAAISDTSIQTRVDIANLVMSPVRVNQAGYRLVDVQEGRAQFYVVGPGSLPTFEVQDLQGITVANGSLSSTGLTATGQVKSERVIDAARSPNPMYRGYPKTGLTSTGVVWVGTIPATVPAGKYQIKLPTGALSAPFVVSANLYGMVRDATIKFFGIQRSGSLADETGLITDTLYSPSWFRAKPAHTWDGWNIDTTGAGAAKYRWKGKLTGGWYDCGDHLKETRTQSFALAMLGSIAATMPEKDADSYGFNHNDTRAASGVGRSDGIPDIVREARWGAHFAIKAWKIAGGTMAGSTIDSTKLYLSVGDFGKDHGWWGQPQNQDVVVPDRGGRQNRPARTDYGSSSLGDWAAGLAFVSRLYRPYDRTGWCDTALKAARDLYELAKKVNRLESSPAYNGESISQDDMAMASTALFWATREKKYLDETILTPGLPNGKGGTCGSNQAATFPGSHFEGGFFGCTSDQMRKSNANTDWASVQSVALYAFFKLFLQNRDTAANYGISDAQRGLLAQRTMANLMANLSARSLGNAGNITFPQIGRSGMDVSYNPLKYDSLWYSMANQMEWVWNRYQMGNLAELYMYWDMTRYLDPSQISLPDLPTPVWRRDKIEKALINGTGVILGMNQWDMSMLLGVGAKNPGHPHHRAANPEGKNVPGANYNYRVPVGALYGGITPGSSTTQLFEQWENWRITETCLDGSAVTLLALTGLAENVPNEAPRMDVKVVGTTDTLARIQIDLDKWGTVKLEYGTDSLLLGGTTTVVGNDTSNRISLRIHPLQPATKYWFKVTATDLAGKSRTQWAWVGSPTDSVRYNFTTKAVPQLPPLYGQIKACNVTSDSADIMWYTPNGEYPSSVMFADSANWVAGNFRYVDIDQAGDVPVKFHHVRLYGLKERTTYNFRVGVPGGPYDEVVGCFRTPITDYKFKVYAGQYMDGAGYPFLALNVVNEEERTFDSLSLRFYVRSTDTLWKSPGVPYTVTGPDMDQVPLTFENSIGVKYDICQAYNSAGFNKECSDPIWGLNWSWGKLSTGVFMLKPVKIPDSFDPVTKTWAYYLEMPLGPTVMNSQSRIRFDARLVARSEWPNALNQGNIDAFNFANSFVNRTDIPLIGDRRWWDEAGPNRASTGHEFITSQDAPKTTTDWSWMPHSVANGDPVDYPGMLKVAKDSFDIVRPEEAVNPYVAVYRKGVFVYGFSPDRKEQATKRTVYAMDVKFDAPFDVANGGTINLESSASTRLTGTIDAYDQLIPTAKGYITEIWVNGVELTDAQRRAAVVRNPNGTWKLDLPLRLYTGTNKVDVTIFAGADSTESVVTDACDEGRPCAFKNSFWFVNSVSKLTPSQIEVFDASGNAASRVTPDSSIVRIRVTDGNANKKPAAADVVTVTLRRAGVDIGTLTLVETGIATGIFELAPVSVVAGVPAVNQVRVLPGDTLELVYKDLEDPEDTSATSIFAISTWPTPTKGAIIRECDGTYKARVHFDRPVKTPGAEIVQNSGFEENVQGSTVGFAYSGPYGAWNLTNVDRVESPTLGLTARSGSYSLDLNSTIPGSISQVLATTVGTPVQVALAYSVNNAGATSKGTTMKAVVTWNAAVVDTISMVSGATRVWLPKSYSLVTTGRDSLAIRAVTIGDGGIMVDDVSVRAAGGGTSFGSSSVVLRGPGSADSLVVTIPAASASVDASGKVLTLPLAGVPDVGNRSGVALVSLADVQGASKLVSQPLVDSVGPWLDSAKIVENLEGRLVDTISLWVSEPVIAPSKAWFLNVQRGGAVFPTTSVVVDSAWLSDVATGRWTVVVRTGIVKAGDQLLLSATQVRDLKGNAAAACPAYRELKTLIRQAPIAQAWIHDANGDGTADQVVLIYKRKLRAGETPDLARIRFGVADSLRADLVPTTVGDSVVKIDLAAPYSRATTMGSGLDGAGSLVLLKGGDSVRVALADSVGPGLLTARLIYGSGATDSVFLTFSEPVTATATGFQRLKTGVAALPVAGAPVDVSSWTWKLVVDTGTIVPGDSIRPTPGGTVVDGVGRSASPLHPWIEVMGEDRPPANAWYSDADGDGAVDRVTMIWARAPRKHPSFKLLWPSLGGGFDTVSLAPEAWVLQPDGRSTVVAIGPFDRGVTSSPTTNLGRQVSDAEVASFPIHDSVPPVLLSVGLVYDAVGGASGSDTLRAIFSEKVSLDAGITGLERFGLPVSAVGFDGLPSSGDLLVWSIPVDTGSLFPGDSLRPTAGSGFSDAVRNRPSPRHPWVVLQGSERPPRSASYHDLDGDGAVDHVVVRWARGPRTLPALTFLWPSLGGGMDSVRLSEGAWSLQPDGRTAILPIGPFDVGVTASGVTDLGRQLSAGTTTAFPIFDSVPAVAMAARVGYAQTEGFADTLFVSWSEVIRWTGAEPLLLVGDGATGTAVHGLSTVMRPDSLGAMILLDASDSLLTIFRAGDKIRLAPASSGTLTDRLGNAVENPTRWVPVLLGRRPPRFAIEFDPNKLKYEGWVIAPEPALQLWVRPAGGKEWVDFASGLPVPGPKVAHGLGPNIILNQPLRGKAIVYDNQGTFVANIDLDLLGDAFYTDRIPKDRDNQYEVRIQWNGLAANDRPAASGVYMIRLVLWQNMAGEGELPDNRVVNQVFKFGWEIPLK